MGSDYKAKSSTEKQEVGEGLHSVKAGACGEVATEVRGGLAGQCHGDR